MFPETVADKLSDAVIEQAMKLSAEDRQELVVSYIAKANEIRGKAALKIGTIVRIPSNIVDTIDRFKNLNEKYKKKFNFPFIYAVKGKSKIEVLNNFKERVAYDINTEFEEAKKQVKKIANLRLTEINKNEKNFF